jgi:hypothetical protein
VKSLEEDSGFAIWTPSQVSYFQELRYILSTTTKLDLASRVALESVEVTYMNSIEGSTPIAHLSVYFAEQPPRLLLTPCLMMTLHHNDRNS